MDIALTKIAQLVADARTELKRLGIDTEGKRSDELLNMAREQRNNLPRPATQTRMSQHLFLYPNERGPEHETRP